ncbi:MAG: hypothetical protein V4696_05125 [Pseudomonadota bacterium]
MANIFASFVQPRSVQDYRAQYDQADMAGLQLEQKRGENAMQKLAREQSVAKQNALQALYANPQMAGNPEALERGMLGNPLLMDQGMKLQKGRLDNANTQAQTLERTATADKTTQDTRTKKREQAIRDIAVLTSTEEAMAGIQAHLAKGDIDEVKAQALVRSLPQNPADFPKWQIGMLRAITSPEALLQSETSLATNKLTNETSAANNKASNDRQAADNAASRAVQMRGQNMTDERSRDKNKNDADAVGKIEWKQDTNGNWIALPKSVSSREPVTPITTTAPGKKEVQAKNSIQILDEAEPLLKSATGSYAGAAYDQAARAVGVGTAGAQDVAKLKTLEGALMMAQPRMEGPQSNLDVQLYRQMAGQIGDATVPAATKQAAAKQIRALQEKYAGVQQTDKLPAGGHPAGFDADKERRYQEWKAKQK